NAQYHDVIYNGWNSSTGDYVYLKAPGNSANTYGTAFVGDNVFAANGLFYTAGRQTINIIDQNQNVIDVQHLPFAHEVWGLFVKDSFLYYSTYGFRQYNLKTKKDRFVKSSLYPELNDATIYSIQQKSKNEFWLCSTKGLFTWNSETQTFEKLIADVNGVSEFQHLYKDENILWLASGGKGLIKFNIDTKSTEFFSFKHPATNIVHAVYPDSYGNLWLSTDYGIVRFNIKSEEYALFRENDGLINNEFNRISHYKDKDGSLIFGGVKGLVRFNPDSVANLDFNQPNLTPFVADAWLYKKGGNEITQVTKDFYKNNAITVEPQDRFLSFDLATNNIEYYNSVEFSYKLDKNDNWKILPSNKLEFNVLPFGTHSVIVKSSLPIGYESKEPLIFSIDVLKPVYLRFWFIALMLFGLLATSIIAVVVRTKRLQNQKALLELEVSKRTQKILEDKQVIEQQTNELKTLDKMKSRFFANISHELRNPLTLIVGPVENLLNQSNISIPSMVRSQMNLTLKNAKSLQKRVNEILALSKIDSGKLELHTESMPLVGFIKRVVLAFESLAKSQNIVIEFNTTINTDTIVALDADQIEKVINNLLSNAIKHSPLNSVIKVNIIALNKNTYQLTVADQGKGVASSEQDKIFDRYYQSKQGEKAGGTGLGLALSNELARLMGGNLAVDKTYQNGAKFVFNFKADKMDSVDFEQNDFEIQQQIVLQQYDQVDIEVTETSANVLVVDDNEEMRAYIKSILDNKCRIYEAENGKEALDVISKRKIDLITSDLMMPEMDGMELLEQLKSNDKTNAIPVIMLTARAEDTDKLSALEIGVNDYLTKPFYARELLARVNNLLLNNKVRQQTKTELPTHEPEVTTDSENQLKQVIEVIKANVGKSTFSVIDLAEQVGYSERQLRRIIKKEKGVTTN
ncbi:MAG: response regulator, partial [Bacteroidia bacterium]